MDVTGERYGSVQLLKDEEVFRAVHPHVLGMYQLYLIWFYFIGVSVLFMVRREALLQWASGWFLGVANNTIYLSMWVAALLVPAVIIAVARISLRWVIWIALAAGLGVYLKEFTEVGVRGSSLYVDNIENLTILALGCLGVAGTEWYRMCHTYLVTNRRIVIASTGLWHSERSLAFSKINDLVLEAGFLGRILNFGTIIPLTGSGLGSGSEMAGGGVGLGTSLFGMNLGIGVGGGHSRNVPKESLAYTLFNVADPAPIQAFILDRMTR